MAKYLLSYDEQDVKNGKLDVSPDGVFRGVPEKITPKVTIDIRPDGLGSYVADTTFFSSYGHVHKQIACRTSRYVYISGLPCYLCILWLFRNIQELHYSGV